MENTKDFVGGKVEVKEFDNGGKIIKLSIPFKELVRIKSDQDWVNIEVKESKGGKMYMENNKYVPKDTQNTAQTPNMDNNEPEIGEPEEYQTKQDDEIKTENIPF